MSESAVLNLVTAFDLLLIGGLMIVMPRAGRRGLLFGAYVGEERSEGEAAERLKSRWFRGCVSLTLASLALGLGLGLAGRPLAGCLSSLALLCLGTVALYLHVHRAARALAPPRTEAAPSAPPPASEPGSVWLPAASLIACLAAGTWGVVDAARHWPEIPERVPTHFGIAGEPDAWSDKSLASVFALPLMNLVMGGILAGMALLIARAPLALRSDPSAEERAAQVGFRRAVVRMLSGTAVLCTALLGVMGAESLRTALGERPGLGHSLWWLTGLLVAFILGYAARLIAHHGQGGARREGASSGAPLTDGLADDRRWKWGVFYINADDPAVLVEKRFGIGYTVNFGQPLGLALVILIVVLLAAVTAISFWGAMG